MAKVVRWTGNGDRQVIDTNDPDEVRRLQNEAWDRSKNIDRVQVTED